MRTEEVSLIGEIAEGLVLRRGALAVGTALRFCVAQSMQPSLLEESGAY